MPSVTSKLTSGFGGFPNSAGSFSARRFLYLWQPIAGSRKAAIAIVHGLGEHAGRYGSLAKHFSDQGYVVLSFDQQGHGHDSGKRGVIDSFLDSHCS